MLAVLNPLATTSSCTPNPGAGYLATETTGRCGPSVDAAVAGAVGQGLKQFMNVMLPLEHMRGGSVSDGRKS